MQLKKAKDCLLLKTGSVLNVEMSIGQDGLRVMVNDTLHFLKFMKNLIWYCLKMKRDLFSMQQFL